MMSFIHNGSKITSWMGIASKPKAQHPEEHFYRGFFEFQSAQHQISTRKLELYANSLKQLFL